jgi:tetratricopeptide (TPR) repeat protein
MGLRGRSSTTRVVLCAAACVCAVVVCAASEPEPPTVLEFRAELHSLKPEIAPALADSARAESVVERLDKAEVTFAKLAADPNANHDELTQDYQDLEDMLSRVFLSYQQQLRACLTLSRRGVICDANPLLGIELRAEYPLAWLKFEGGAKILANDPSRAESLLRQAIDHFSHLIDSMADRNLIRENLLGRAYCERELGRYDRKQDDRAISDFDSILRDGPHTPQYDSAWFGRESIHDARRNIVPIDSAAGSAVDPGRR